MLLGAILMLVLSLALSWLPLVGLPPLGPLIGGAVGGYYSGSTGRALISAILPAVVLGVFVWWMGKAMEHAIAGFLFGVATFILVVAHEIVLVLGALAGGFFAHHRHRRANGVTGDQ